MRCPVLGLAGCIEVHQALPEFEALDPEQGHPYDPLSCEPQAMPGSYRSAAGGTEADLPRRHSQSRMGRTRFVELEQRRLRRRQRNSPPPPRKTTSVLRQPDKSLLDV